MSGITVWEKIFLMVQDVVPKSCSDRDLIGKITKKLHKINQKLITENKRESKLSGHKTTKKTPVVNFFLLRFRHLKRNFNDFTNDVPLEVYEIFVTAILYPEAAACDNQDLSYILTELGHFRAMR